jgi:N-acetyl-anhydromuramyl-L-alanine amidase AmpD
MTTLLATGCAHTNYGLPGAPLERLGDEIMIAGQLFHTGAPVVLWTDPGGYDAYRAHRHFDPDEWMPTKPVSDDPVRYGTYRRNLPEDVTERVRGDGWDLDTLATVVDQFVYHYDVCGTSRRCFKVLQDMRGLSVHFMLDVDGTIYQTLDAKERAWHAGTANDRSVGIEIANIGAYSPDDTNGTLDKWYGVDEDGRTINTIPESIGPTGIRTPDFVPYPSRREPVCGELQGQEVCQYDLTDEQYDSLIKLTATLCTALPGIRVDYPRDADGKLIPSVLSAEELAEFSGLLGHWHVSQNKIDPGPAFDWDRVVYGVERLMR